MRRGLNPQTTGKLLQAAGITTENLPIYAGYTKGPEKQLCMAARLNQDGKTQQILDAKALLQDDGEHAGGIPHSHLYIGSARALHRPYIGPTSALHRLCIDTA